MPNMDVLNIAMISSVLNENNTKHKNYVVNSYLLMCRKSCMKIKGT